MFLLKSHGVDYKNSGCMQLTAKHVIASLMKVWRSIIINEAKTVLNKFISLLCKTSANNNYMNKYVCILCNTVHMNDTQRWCHSHQLHDCDIHWFLSEEI